MSFDTGDIVHVYQDLQTDRMRYWRYCTCISRPSNWHYRFYHNVYNVTMSIRVSSLCRKSLLIWPNTCLFQHKSLSWGGIGYDRFHSIILFNIWRLYILYIIDVLQNQMFIIKIWYDKKKFYLATKSFYSFKTFLLAQQKIFSWVYCFTQKIIWMVCFHFKWIVQNFIDKFFRKIISVLFILCVKVCLHSIFFFKFSSIFTCVPVTNTSLMV